MLHSITLLFFFHAACFLTLERTKEGKFDFLILETTRERGLHTINRFSIVNAEEDCVLNSSKSQKSRAAKRTRFVFPKPGESQCGVGSNENRTLDK